MSAEPIWVGNGYYEMTVWFYASYSNCTGDHSESIQHCWHVTTEPHCTQGESDAYIYHLLRYCPGGCSGSSCA